MLTKHGENRGHELHAFIPPLTQRPLVSAERSKRNFSPGSPGSDRSAGVPGPGRLTTKVPRQIPVCYVRLEVWDLWLPVGARRGRSPEDVQQ